MSIKLGGQQLQNLQLQNVQKSGLPDANLQGTVAKTEGDNQDAKPLGAIIGGDGSKGNPYILDGKDMAEDLKYMKGLLDKHGGMIYYKWTDENGDEHGAGLVKPQRIPECPYDPTN